MQRNLYLERWAAWLPQALIWLGQDPPNYKEAKKDLPQPERPALPFRRPTEPARVALLTSAAAYDVRTQARYNSSCVIGDSSWRAFPYDLPDDRIDFAHEHIDLQVARADHEVVLPRLALKSCDVAVTEHVISWHGYTYDLPAFIEETVPQIVARAHADGATAALLIPV